MAEFILLVRVPVNYTTELAQEVNPKWDVVLDNWKSAGIFVTSYVFPSNGYILSGESRSVKNESVVSENVKVVSSIILLATDLEQAMLLARDCPVLDYGGTIEVREIRPRPSLTK
jgi:hypothetical protein